MEAWIFAISRNLTRDYFRKKGRRPFLENVDDLSGVLPDYGKPVGYHLERAETSRQLSEAMEQLTDKERELLYLRCELEMTSGEVGRILGATPGAIRERQRVAVKKLRESMLGAEGK